jgi:hypothetical protein
MPTTCSNAFSASSSCPSLADDEHELGLVVEVRHARRADDVFLVAGQAGVELDEAGRLAGQLLDQAGALQLGEMGPVVLADAEELLGVGHRRLPHDLAQVGLRRRSRIGEERPGPVQAGGAGAEQLAHRAVGKLDHAVGADHADPVPAGLGACGEGDKSHGYG